MLHLAAATTLGAIAGCYDYPRHRDLIFSGVRKVGRSGDAYVYEVTPKKSNSGGSDQWETFHDVTLIGYDESGTEVCRENIGDIPESSTGSLDPVRVTCSTDPVMFTYAADESPCDDDTVIGVAVYRTDPNGDSYWWLDEQRECGEGLPPEAA